MNSAVKKRAEATDPEVGKNRYELYKYAIDRMQQAIEQGFLFRSYYNYRKPNN